MFWDRDGTGFAGGLRSERLCRLRRDGASPSGPRCRLSVACLACKFVDVRAAQVSAIAAKALERSAALYAVAKEAHEQPARAPGCDPLGRGRGRDDQERGLQMQLPKMFAKTPLAATIRDVRSRLKRVGLYVGHGVLKIVHNPLERAMRPVARGRKNHLFMGSVRGDRAIACSLIETAKLNDVGPQARLAQILDRFSDYRINRADELLPWNCSSTADPGPFT